MRTVKVSLDERSYPIRIGEGLLKELGPQCAQLKLGQRCSLITDETVAGKYQQPVMASLRAAGFQPTVIKLKSGERTKKLQNVHACYERFATHRLERNSFVVALGGGVVGDLAGFAAATYLRGTHFVQVPTTLLAQVDSSVGGKVGVNLAAGKNLVGAFHQPRLVLCDLDTLRTLPPREFRAGLAEIIKYGIIYDARLFNRLERDLPLLLKQDASTLAAIIARCCQIKAKVVSQDEKESGLRAILNFGHTVGHALEAISRYGKYLHGEAISIGQVVAAIISREQTGLPAKDADRIVALLERAGLPVSVKLSATQTRRLLEAIRLDKKVSGGETKFVLVKRIGRVITGQAVPSQVVRQALNRK